MSMRSAPLYIASSAKVAGLPAEPEELAEPAEGAADPPHAAAKKTSENASRRRRSIAYSKHGGSLMRNGFRVIDGDGHMQEPLDIWDKYVEKAFYDRRPLAIDHVGKVLFAYAPCEAYPKGRPKSRPDSLFDDFPQRYGEAYDSWWSMATRLEHMDQEGIDVMVGFPTNGNAATTLDIADPKLM